MHQDDLLTVKAVAKMLGYKSPSSVLRHIERGNIPAKQLFPGTLWRIRRGDVEDILKRGGLAPEESSD